MPDRQHHDHDHDEEEHDRGDKPVTTGDLIKWGGVLSALCTMLVSLVWFCASIKSDQALQKAELESLKRQVEDRRTVIDKRLEGYDAKLSSSDKAIADLQSKLAEAVTLLKRIDEKVGKP